MIMKKIFISFTIVGIIIPHVAALATAHAADFTVSPAVIDDHALPNDILNYSLTVTNTSGKQQNVFASVYEITKNGDQMFLDPTSPERTTLLADWIGISRGALVFQPGESKTLPVTINVNPYATAGEYHAAIAFVEGGTRDEAEKQLNGAPQALVDLTVASNAKEELTLVNFSPQKRFASSLPLGVVFTLKNTGTVSSTPGGLVLFYDHIGHTVGSVPANPQDVSLAPGEEKTFTASWDGIGAGMGEYKASLEVSYGANDAQLADTALVWILPWQKILIIFFILLVVVIALTVMAHRAYLRQHHRRASVIKSLVDRLKQHEGKNAHHVVDLRGPSEPPRPPHSHHAS